MKKTGDSWDFDWTHPVEDNGRLYKHETFYTIDEYLEWAKKHPRVGSSGRMISRRSPIAGEVFARFRQYTSTVGA